MKYFLILCTLCLTKLAYCNDIDALQLAIMDKIDDNFKDMQRFLCEPDYLKNPQWNYLNGKNDALYEVLFIIEKN